MTIGMLHHLLNVLEDTKVQLNDEKDALYSDRTIEKALLAYGIIPSYTSTTK